MAFIKTHLISLVCGVAALAFIALAIVGMTSKSVVTQMQQKAGISGKIAGYKSAPKNAATIEAEAERGRRFAEEYANTLAAAQEINARQPLMEDAFPEPQQIARAYDFRDAYREAMRRLPMGRLAGGDLPTDAEIESARIDLAEAEEQRRLEEDEGGETHREVRVGAEPPTQAARPAFTFPGGPPGTPSRTGGPAEAARLKAQVEKARSIRCYVTAAPEAQSPTFHVVPIGVGGDPRPDEMWYAQVSLWIQQDVVDALAALNDQAAKELPAEIDADVSTLPVKRLQSIRLEGYVTELGFVPFPGPRGSSAAAPPPSFTGKVGDSRFDVVRFTVEVVVDQRKLLAVIDALTRQNFFVLVSSEYKAVPPTDPDRVQGYLYGSDPVVRATLGFEAYMARDVYEKYFPPDIRKVLAVADKAKDKKGPKKSGDKP